MKKILKGYLLFLIIFLGSIQTVSAASVKVTLNHTPLAFDTPPVIENGRVLVPMRGILESLGYSVHWQEQNKTVSAIKGDMTISLPLDSQTVQINNEPVTIDVPAKLHNSRTFVPLRFLAEYSGANVIWDNASSTVVIHSNDAVGYKKEDSVVYIQTNKMQGSGVILNTSSMVSLTGQPSGFSYPASKFAVNGLTVSLARELGPKGIRVNAVAPGITETDMMKAVPKEVIEPMIRQIPLRRLGQPEDIANAFVFLASEEASYITGVVLSVDGMARS